MMQFNKTSLSQSNFFVQKIDKIKSYQNRKDLFSILCKDKRILHVGCTDYPFSLTENNLHLYLNTLNPIYLDGMDVDTTGLDQLSNIIPGEYFTNLKNIEKFYDIILVPETIEHVPNIQQFIDELSKLNFNKMLITAPCFFSQAKNNDFGFIDNVYYEIVHPDHKAWFTPYTLKNCISQYSDLLIDECYILEHGHMVGVLASKQQST